LAWRFDDKAPKVSLMTFAYRSTYYLGMGAMKKEHGIKTKFILNIAYVLQVFLVQGTPHCKKRLAIFPSPAGMSLPKLSLGRNNL